MKLLPSLLLAMTAAAAAGAAGYFLAGGPRTASTTPGQTSPAAAAPETPAAAGQDAKAKAPPPPRRVEEPHPANWPAFSIELAAFRSLPAAREFAGEMTRRQLPVDLVETVDAAGRSWYRVRWGKFPDPRQAAGRLGEIQQISGIAGIVTGELPATAVSGTPSPQ